MKIVDARGQLCPAPLILTKRAIKAATKGDQITVIVDNDTARINLMSFLGEMKLNAQCVVSGSEFNITFTTDGARVTMPEVEEYCEMPRIGGYAVAITSLTMGHGSDELGEILMRACVNSLDELDRLPQTVVLYNEGVKLATRDRDTAASFEKLALAGVRILACGACVDYFDIKAKLSPAVSISNMLQINTVLSTATHVIYP